MALLLLEQLRAKIDMERREGIRKEEIGQDGHGWDN